MMKTTPSTEFVLLGVLMEGPKHGYEIRRFMDKFLGSTWYVGTSQLYLLLKKLEKSNWLISSIKKQELRPSKRIYSLTPAGRTALLGWTCRPIEHVRDFRIEFLTKLFFLRYHSLKGGDRLVDEQVEWFKKLQDRLKRKLNAEKNPYARLVFSFKLSTAKAGTQWLLKEARPFIQKIQDS